MADEPAGTTPESTDLPFDTHDMSASQAIEAIGALEDPEQITLEALHYHEGDHPQYDGGRKTVLDALEERIGEVEVEPEGDGEPEGAEVPSSGDTGGASEEDEEEESGEESLEPGDIGSTVLARVGAQEHDATVVEEADAVYVEINDGQQTRVLVDRNDIRAKV